ncbi:MAG TPA: flagellar hook-length control protein FliK [Syntrophales bacterium]|jgi:hypothetical protein|nr:flagellar hook-length control protein FliK [Syntrophales bacterium]HQA82694.1 flagellar hook-length control protein FliK [Syntrophales bacterium]
MDVNPVSGIPSRLLIRALRQKFDSQGFPDLHPGDRLDAQVTRKLGEGKILVLLKGTQVEADTKIPLQVGQKIQVQVESLEPQVLLRLVADDAAGERGKITGYLKAFRSDPQAFADLFEAAADLFKPDHLKTLSNGLLRSQARSLGQMIRTLIFSSETLENPLFIRDFVFRSGFLLERALDRHLKEGAPAETKAQPGADNLKSALIRFGAEVRQWLGSRPDIPAEEFKTLIRLAEYADRSVHSLETQQILNVLSRDQENRFMVQIPFAFSQNLAMQDIFIEFGGNPAEENEKGSPFRIVFFLNFDALGEMMIDVVIRDQELAADLSCQNVDVMTLVSSSLEKLKENLDSLGFRVVRMACDVRDDIGPTRNDYVRNSSWYEGDVINFFA